MCRTRMPSCQRPKHTTDTRFVVFNERSHHLKTPRLTNSKACSSVFRVHRGTCKQGEYKLIVYVPLGIIHASRVLGVACSAIAHTAHTPSSCTGSPGIAVAIHPQQSKDDLQQQHNNTGKNTSTSSTEYAQQHAQQDQERRTSRSDADSAAARATDRQRMHAQTSGSTATDTRHQQQTTTGRRQAATASTVHRLQRRGCTQWCFQHRAEVASTAVLVALSTTAN
jgi:hypothetical protein